MKNFVYITTNLISGKQYVGSHNGKKSGYKGSGILILKAIKKYKAENFKREILIEKLSIKEARNLEGKYIEEYNTLQPNGYNISPTGGLGDYGCHSETTKKKIGDSNRGKKRSVKTRQLMAKKAMGRKNNQKYFSKDEKHIIVHMHLMFNQPITKIARKLNVHKDRIKRFLERNNYYVSHNRATYKKE